MASMLRAGGREAIPVVHVSQGTKNHGAVTLGTAPVVVRAANDKRVSFIGQCDGPGKAAVGNSGVSVASPNSPKLAAPSGGGVGGDVVIDHCTDAIYAVADQASTTLLWLEEVEP